MYIYNLYMKENGKNRLAHESRSPFPPTDERGQQAIANCYKLAQTVGLPGPVAVALMNRDGTNTWFDRQGREMAAPL